MDVLLGKSSGNRVFNSGLHHRSAEPTPTHMCQDGEPLEFGNQALVVRHHTPTRYRDSLVTQPPKQVAAGIVECVPLFLRWTRLLDDKDPGSDAASSIPIVFS